MWGGDMWHLEGPWVRRCCCASPQEAFPGCPALSASPLPLGLHSRPPGPPDTHALGRGRSAAVGPELRGLLWRLYPHCMAEWALLLETFTFLWHCHKCRYEGRRLWVLVTCSGVHAMRRWECPTLLLFWIVVKSIQHRGHHVSHFQCTVQRQLAYPHGCGTDPTSVCGLKDFKLRIWMASYMRGLQIANIYFSEFWNLWGPRLWQQQISCPMRACFCMLALFLL